MNLINFILWRLIDLNNLLKNVYICYKKHLSPRLILCCDMVLSEIPNSTYFPHPFGIAIKGGTVLGNNVMIRQNVTIGIRYHVNEPGCVIGDNVVIGANSLILGSVKVGKNSVIGAGSIVLKDVPENITVKGVWK